MKHAKSNQSFGKKIVAIFIALATSFGVIVAAQASTTIDVNQGTLKFDTAVFEVDAAARWAT